MNTLTLILFFSFIFLMNLISVSASGGPIDNLQPGAWYEVPNSKIRDVLPNPLPPGTTGPAAVVSAWSGAAYDTARDCYIVTGGGHGDYAGNELYSLCLNTLQWQRIWGPTPNASIPPVTQGGSETYLNGDPASVHTYGGLQYLPNVDRLWRFSGSLWGGSGGFGKIGWFFDFASSSWQQRAAGIYAFGTIPYSAYDTVTGHVFVHRYNRFEEYDPTNDTWSTRGSYGPGTTPSASAVIDPVRRKFLLIGSGAVQQYDLNLATSNLTAITTTGDTAPLNAAYPGVEYDPVSDRIVAWIGGADVYALNMNTLVWTKISPAATNNVIPTAPPGTGTHGRWRYIPSKNAFIVVNSIDQNAYVYKLSPLPATPPSPAWINVPLNTWVARPIPTNGSAPCKGGVCKHMDLDFNPDDKLIYFVGGDHDGSGSSVYNLQSGRNELYTYSVANDQWNLIQSYCRADGLLQQDSPTEVGWTYDSSRKVFWFVPGFMWNHNLCPNDVAGKIMTFDPASGTWALPVVTPSPRGNEGNYTQYDPVTDTLIRFVNAGPEVNIYTIATDSWLRKSFGLPNENFSDVGTTIDVAGRRIFLLTANKLYEYNIDSKNIVNRGPTPVSTYAETKPVWDPINQVLLWPDFRDTDNSTGGPQEQVHLHIYHPNTNSWDVDVPVLAPQGITVKGRHAVFDPSQNVMMVYGNTWNIPRSPYIFLYRYGNGNGTPLPPPPTASLPPAPTNLTVQ
jgi:hypothetical protein